MSLIARFRLTLQRFEQYLQRLTSIHLNNQTQYEFALDIPAGNAPDTQPKSSILQEIFDPFLHAVPKERRTLERRKQRRMGDHAMHQYIQIKKNLIMCQECGHWHERRTICGNCYEKVKEETEAMKKELGEAMKYTPDQKELSFVYKGEERPKFEGQYIVEMPKPRPKWFSDSLMTKVKGSKEE